MGGTGKCSGKMAVFATRSHTYCAKAGAIQRSSVETGFGQKPQVKLFLAGLWLKAPDVGRCVSIGCKCIVSPTAVRLLPGEGAKGLICRHYLCLNLLLADLITLGIGCRPVLRAGYWLQM